MKYHLPNLSALKSFIKFSLISQGYPSTVSNNTLNSLFRLSEHPQISTNALILTALESLYLFDHPRGTRHEFFRNYKGFSIIFPILLHEKFLRFDCPRAVVFQLNLKYLHVKITNLSWEVVQTNNSIDCSQSPIFRKIVEIERYTLRGVYLFVEGRGSRVPCRGRGYQVEGRG